MNLGSLFIDLGVKGGAQAKSQVGSLREGLRDAAIIANQTVQLMSKVYSGTKNLVQENAAWGVSLTNASKDLNISTDALQRWDYAARLTGAKAGEMDGAFKNLQGTILGIADSGDLPDYFAHLMSNMSQVDKAFDSNRFLSGDLEYAMSSIRKLANSGGADLARLNKALSSMGFSDGVANFLKNGTTSLSGISNKLIVDKNGVKSLDEMYKSLVEIEQVSQVAFADIAKIFDKKLIEEIKGLIVELSNLLQLVLNTTKEKGLIGGVADKVRTFGSGVKAFNKYGYEPTKDVVSGVASGSYMKRVDDGFQSLVAKIAVPAYEALGGKVENKPVDGQVQINNYITSMDDAMSIGDAAANGTLQGIEKANTMMQIQPTRGTTGNRPKQ